MPPRVVGSIVEGAPMMLLWLFQWYLGNRVEIPPSLRDAGRFSVGVCPSLPEAFLFFFAPLVVAR